MPSRTIRVHDVDLHVRESGGGEPLVLLHGFTGSGDDWTHVFDLEALAREYRLVVPDARGHGQSIRTEARFTHRQCALDLLALLDGLGIDRFKAVGASLGGNTLLYVATIAPERVEAMVAVAATPYYPEQARAAMREHFTARELADDVEDMNFTAAKLARVQARTLLVNGDRDLLYPIEPPSRCTARSRTRRSSSCPTRATAPSTGSGASPS